MVLSFSKEEIVMSAVQGMDSGGSQVVYMTSTTLTKQSLSSTEGKVIEATSMIIGSGISIGVKAAVTSALMPALTSSAALGATGVAAVASAPIVIPCLTAVVIGGCTMYGIDCAMSYAVKKYNQHYPTSKDQVSLISDCNQKLVAAAQQVQRARSEVETKIHENKENIDNLNKETEKLRDNVEKLISEVDGLRKDKDTASTLIVDLTLQNEKLTTEKEKLTKDCEDRDRHIEKIEKKLESVMSENKKLRTEL